MSDSSSGSGWFQNMFPGWFSSAAGGGGSGTGAGGTTNTQGNPMLQYMMAQSLMQGTHPSSAPTSSAVGAAGQAFSPLINYMMLSRMQNQNQPQAPQMQGYAPAMTPGQQGVGGFVAPMGPSSEGFSGSGAGAGVDAGSWNF